MSNVERKGLVLQPEGSGGVTPGTYFGTFTGMVEGENEHGPNYYWGFTLDDGRKCGRYTSRVIKPSTAAGRMLLSITGGGEPGQTLYPEDYFGRRYLIVVEPAPSGKGTRVATVAMPPTHQ